MRHALTLAFCFLGAPAISQSDDGLTALRSEGEVTIEQERLYRLDGPHLTIFYEVTPIHLVVTHETGEPVSRAMIDPVLDQLVSCPPPLDDPHDLVVEDRAPELVIDYRCRSPLP